MHRNLTPHTWMHWKHHLSSKYTDILPLTHECTEIIRPQVNAPKSYPPNIKKLQPLCTEIIIPQVNSSESYPSHMNAQKSSFPNKCTRILPLTHECTAIVTPQVNAPQSYRSHMNAPKSSLHRSMHKNLTTHTWMHWNHPPSSKCTGILPLTHECTEIVTPQVNAPESYPSHVNAPKSSLLR